MSRMVRYVVQLILVISFVFVLSACNQSTQEETKHSYSDLTESQQQVVDGVLAAYDEWESVYDTGKYWGCTNVTFFKEDGALIFATCYRFSDTEEVAQGVWSTGTVGYKIFKVDSATGELTGHNYSIYDSAKKNAACVRALAGHKFDDLFDDSARKNALANEYYNAIYSLN